MSFGRVRKGGAGRNNSNRLGCWQQGMATWHFKDGTCPAEPLCCEVFVIYSLSSGSKEEELDMRKTNPRRECNSKSCAIHLLLHTVLKADQPKATHFQGLLATSTEHELLLVCSQGCVPAAKTAQAKNYQTPKCKEGNKWIDDSVTKAQVSNNVSTERWKTHLLFLSPHCALSHHHTNSYFHCSHRPGLAKNEPCASLPSPPPGLSSHGQIHKDLILRRNQSRPALQTALESAQVSHQLPQSGFCMPVVPSPAWLTCLVPLALCCLGSHPPRSAELV